MIAENKIFNEKACLQVVFIFCLITAPFALVIGILTHSTALILSGVICTFDAFTSFITLIIFKLLTRSPSKTYHFGYFKFEPLLIVIETTVIIATCMVSFIHALKDLYHQSAFIVNHKIGFYYIAFAIISDVLISIYIYFCIKTKSSPLLELELVGWYYDLLCTLALLIGFIISYVLERSADVHLQHLAAFTDPVMSIFVVLFIITKPFFLFRENIRDIVDRKPEEPLIEDTILEIMKQCAKELHINIDIEYIKLRRAGRTYFCLIKYCVDNQVTLQETTLFNENVKEKVEHTFSHFHMELIAETNIKT
ncbi:MAG: cation transporter [Alphaproteobacteria bacterium]|nr:cation transporter [Alphaproteobacteria bacterium]